MNSFSLRTLQPQQTLSSAQGYQGQIKCRQRGTVSDLSFCKVLVHDFGDKSCRMFRLVSPVKSESSLASCGALAFLAGFGRDRC